MNKEINFVSDESEVIKLQLEAFQTKSSVLEKVNKALSTKTEYLEKDNELLKDEILQLKSENSNLLVQLSGLQNENQNLRNELSKHENIVLQKTYQQNRFKARELIAKRLSITTNEKINKRVLERIFSITEWLLKDSDVRYNDIKLHYKIKKSTLALDLKRLRDAGLIKRKSIKGDNYVTLSEAGRKLSTDFRNVIQ